MRKLASVVFVLLISIAVKAQTGSLRVNISNSQQLAVENATAEILRAKDSGLVKSAISNKSGDIEIDNIRFGDYILKVSAVNFEPYFSAPFTVSAEKTDVSLARVQLQQRSTQLGEVTVTSKKPFIQKLTDRIVVNVESSIVSAGSSAMDVLERSPGVNVDQNDNISLRGRSGVIVMIDGKTTAMSGADLANYLKGLPAATLERIDIITNPSAKYDAAGNSGIIDIRMKKDQ